MLWCWQDAQDVFLEQERDRMLTLKLVTLQKVIRGWHHRRQFRQMKRHCVTLQKYFRSFLCTKKYHKVAYHFLHLLITSVPWHCCMSVSKSNQPVEHAAAWLAWLKPCSSLWTTDHSSSIAAAIPIFFYLFLQIFSPVILCLPFSCWTIAMSILAPVWRLFSLLSV